MIIIKTNLSANTLDSVELLLTNIVSKDSFGLNYSELVVHYVSYHKYVLLLIIIVVVVTSFGLLYILSKARQ